MTHLSPADDDLAVSVPTAQAGLSGGLLMGAGVFMGLEAGI